MLSDCLVYILKPAKCKAPSQHSAVGRCEVKAGGDQRIILHVSIGLLFFGEVHVILQLKIRLGEDNPRVSLLLTLAALELLAPLVQEALDLRP